MKQRFSLIWVIVLLAPLSARADPVAAVTLEDLRAEAAKAPPAWAALLRVVTRPADEAILKDGGQALVKPGSAFFPAAIESDDLDLLEPLKEQKSLPRDQVKSVRWFEERVLDLLDGFLQDKGAELTEEQRLDNGERLLRFLLNEHQSVRASLAPSTNPWAPVERRVRKRLDDLRGALLDSCTDGADVPAWQRASQRADAWLPNAAIGTTLAGKIRDLWLRRAAARLSKGQFAEVGHLLNRLDAAFAYPKEAAPLRKQLQAQAQVWWEEGRKLKAANPNQAADKMRQAVELWPGLPGAIADWLAVDPQPKPIRVAMRSRPLLLSPALAATDAERRCLDLLYEPLVAGRWSEGLGHRQVPRLAAELPRLQGERLLVTLTPGRFWSNGDPITATDLRHTLGLPGFVHAHADDLGPPRLTGSPWQVEFHLRHSPVDPLACLNFPVLPAQVRGKPLMRADDPDLAKQPVGSGPFILHGDVTEGGQTWTVFLPNLLHPGWKNRPRQDMHPLWVTGWSDFAKDLAAAKPHLVLDVADQHGADLSRLGYPEPKTRWEPRVFIVAVNHRQALLADKDMRRALAMGLNREQLLAKHFRAAGSSHHRAVNGPYPPDSWAACPPPRVPASLHQADLARSLAKKVAKLGKIHLRLAHAKDDPRQAGACQDIAQQWRDLFEGTGADFRLDLIPLTPAALRQALAQRDFDLALHSMDYPDPSFWLGAVLDDRPEALAPGGSNYLGYSNDAKLQTLLGNLQAQRQFSRRRDIQHDLHAHLHERMPFIPLWQLQGHSAVHGSLQLGEVDPAAPFANVMAWRLK